MNTRDFCTVKHTWKLVIYYIGTQTVCMMATIALSLTTNDLLSTFVKSLGDDGEGLRPLKQVLNHQLHFIRPHYLSTEHHLMQYSS